QVCHVFADGVHFEYAKPRTPDAKKPEPPKKDDKPKEEAKKPADPKKPEAAKQPEKEEQASEIEADRKPKIHTGGNVLIRGATVLTVTNGTHPQSDILVHQGKIAKIGRRLEVPTGTAVMDAEGMFVMPGIIDTHCH